MKKIMSMIVVMLILFSMSITVFAETTTETTSEKKVSIPENLLTDDQKVKLAASETKERIKEYGSWVGIGKEIGAAVDGSLSSLTKRAGEFADTKLGIFTMVIVAYKIVGDDIIQFIIGFPLLFFGIIIWIFSFYRNCIKRKVLVRSEGIFKKKEYDIVNDDVDGELQLVYFICLAIFIATCALIIFV